MESDLNFYDKYGWDILLALITLVILWKGLSIVGDQIKAKGLGPYSFKALGLVVLLPIILILGANEMIAKEVLATLLGTIAGYIFGVEKKPD